MKVGIPGKWLQKKARHGMRGYPIGSIAFYGPNKQRASKLAAAVIAGPDSEPELRRWLSETGDVRKDGQVLTEVTMLMREHAVRTVAMVDDIIGCPHEEGIDYPSGEPCPRCPFWAGRDRWTGQKL